MHRAPEHVWERYQIRALLGVEGIGDVFQLGLFWRTTNAPLARNPAIA
ncbi:MAG TPA: hypothetical protein VLY24_12985 [Bryobacteraceae bacterium]|nr:hypothetical protein [Bryobacteraceae bacterium]